MHTHAIWTVHDHGHTCVSYCVPWLPAWLVLRHAALLQPVPLISIAGIAADAGVPRCISSSAAFITAAAAALEITRTVPQRDSIMPSELHNEGDRQQGTV
jgi:hypothetical protein